MPTTRSVSPASANPPAMPSALPAAPISAPSATMSAVSRRRVTPSTRSNANCARRRTTASACVENTSRPPVKSATSASTSRFTRYDRDSPALAASVVCGRCALTPAGSCSRSAVGECRDIDARSKPKVDAADPADAVERLLRAGDVHHREALRTAGGKLAGNAQRHVGEPDLHANFVADPHRERAHRGGRDEQRVRTQRVEPLRRRGDEPGLDESGTEDIDADDPERVVAARELRVDLDHGTRHGHARQPREHRIDALVEPGTRPAHLEIGLAGKRLHALRELVHRRLVDELHRVAERDAERDREHGERGTHPVLRERAPQHRTGGREARTRECCPHRHVTAPRFRATRRRRAGRRGRRLPPRRASG